MRDVDDIVNEVATEAADAQLAHDLPLLERIADLEAQLATARGLIALDRTGLAAGLDNVRKIANGYSWLGPGDEWGCYTCDEQTEENLRAEMGRCLSEIIDTAVTALRASGVRADRAFNGPFDLVVEQSRIEALESQLAAKDRRIEELNELLDVHLSALEHDGAEWSKELARADKAEADRLDAVHAQQEMYDLWVKERKDCIAAEARVRELQLALSDVETQRDKAEAERDELMRRECRREAMETVRYTGDEIHVDHEAAKIAERRWPGSRLFPEEADRG